MNLRVFYLTRRGISDGYLDRSTDYGKFMEKDLSDQVKQRKIILYNQVVKMVVLAPKM